MGQDCELHIDDGKWSDGVNMFSCDCDDTGLTGQTCQVDIAEWDIPDCEDSPCRNNARCYEYSNTPTLVPMRTLPGAETRLLTTSGKNCSVPLTPLNC